VLPHTLPILLAIVGLFWILRVLLRVFFSQLHAWSDSSERVVLISTYLAMQEGNTQLSEQERLLFFSQIFRHGSTGVYDDASPETPLKLLTELPSGTTASAGRGGR
jgi:hypothetical protein